RRGPGGTRPAGRGTRARLPATGNRKSALEDRRHAHAAGAADRDQHAAAAPLLQLLGGGGDDARASGGERVAGGQRGTDRVDLFRVDAPPRGVEAYPVAAVLLA